MFLLDICIKKKQAEKVIRTRLNRDCQMRLSEEA